MVPRAGGAALHQRRVASLGSLPHPSRHQHRLRPNGILACPVLVGAGLLVNQVQEWEGKAGLVAGCLQVPSSSIHRRLQAGSAACAHQGWACVASVCEVWVQQTTWDVQMKLVRPVDWSERPCAGGRGAGR